MSTPVPPRRRLRHRIPTSLRQHWKLPVAFIAFVAVVATVFGSTRVRPYITGDATIIASEITRNVTGTVDLFDASVTHELSIEIGDAEYDDMISAFRKNGDKKWINASVVIDGTRIDDAAVRLKGNSTLIGLRGESPFEGFAPPEGMEPPEGMQPPPGMEPPEGMQPPQGMQPPAGFEVPGGFDPGQGPPGMGGTTQVTPDDPTSLPLLISFDENVEGRAYQGMTELSVRPGSPVLNEAMALSLTAETGQPTQRYAYTVYSVNDSSSTTRLVLEHPDAGYADSLFDSDGYLYKADASSRFEYVGDDQSDYADQFTQINATDSGTLQPIIDFLKWLDSADAAEFDAHLADRVDVDSFARYVATQNLLVNTDDMSGPGQNYYLWYDLGTEKLSVISWDLNLAMQGDATVGPHDTLTMGPGGMPGGGDGESGAPRGGNTLKTRFLASDAFASLYEDAYRDLFEQIYGSGRALDVLDEVAASVPTSDGLTAEALQQTVDSMRSWIEQRILSGHDL